MTLVPHAEVRRGLYTAGTHIRWETLEAWLAGAATLKNRLAEARGAVNRERLEAAERRHAAALAHELDMVAKAPREQVLRLAALLNQRPWTDPGQNEARLRVATAADTRDEQLRRLDDEPDGPRCMHAVLIVQPIEPPLRRPVIRNVDINSAGAAHAASLAVTRAKARPGSLVVAGAPDGLPAFVGIFHNGVLVAAKATMPPLPVPWHQAWRAEVRSAITNLLAGVTAEVCT